MRFLALLVAVSLAVTVTPPLVAQDEGARDAGVPVALPEWMAGCWEQVSDGAHTIECWTPAQGNMMFGSNSILVNDEVVFWEAMQIALPAASEAPTDSNLTFWAAPRGEWRTAFAGEVLPDQLGLEFVNPSTDFPQKIRYWREGDALHAEISLMDGSKSTHWRFRKMDFTLKP